MTSPRQLAEALGVGLASDLPPRADAQRGLHGGAPSSPASLSASKERERLSPHVKRAFEKMQPHALVLVGTRGPVSVSLFENGEIVKRFGGNRGCWPLKLGSSSAWKDTITSTYNRGPFFFCGALFRLWCESAEHEARLAAQVATLLGMYRETAFGLELESGFTDVGPEIDIDMLCSEVRAIAARMGLRAWDDDDLVRELERRASKQLVGART